tara:strand:+ start:7907 stop:8842 length:936 start_codon:yes stop_codon:yes gene_type:complete
MENNNIYNFTLEVDKEDRVDKLLSNYFLEYSRSTIQKWISTNNVKIDGNLCSQKDKVKKNCHVSINISTKPEVNLIAEEIAIDIIDESDDYIIVNKPSGMVTHIAPGNYNGTLQNALFYKYPELADVPRTGIIHRLDKDTSGILVISRNLISHNYLSKQLQDRKFKKKYHAIVSGIIDSSMRIEEPIARHPVDRKKMAVSSKGRFACSIIKPLKFYENTSHVEVDIITGRTHQIRVHMAYKKHPIIGDRLYGFKKNIFVKSHNILNSINFSFGQYLHAHSLSFADPKTNVIKTYSAPYPKDYQLLLDVISG